MNGAFNVPPPVNEPVLPYAAGTAERSAVKTKLAEMVSEEIEIPILIDGEEMRTGEFGTQVMPHDHGHVLAKWHMAGPREVEQGHPGCRPGPSGVGVLECGGSCGGFPAGRGTALGILETNAQCSDDALPE